MRLRVIARSVSRPVWERLGKGSFSARVVAVFERACLTFPLTEEVARRRDGLPEHEFYRTIGERVHAELTVLWTAKEGERVFTPAVDRPLGETILRVLGFRAETEEE